MGRVKRLFSAWRQGGRDRGGPPPPDHGVPITVYGRGEAVVEVLTGGVHRIGIAKDRSGIYHLYPETWARDWDSLGQAMWFRSGNADRVSHSLEDARTLAREDLAAMGDPYSR